MSQYRPLPLGGPTPPYRVPSYASTDSHCTKCSTQPPTSVIERTGVSWEGSRLNWPAFVGSVAILLTWIGAAGYLYQVKFFLPLNFWDVSIGGRLGDGNYNQLIQVVSGLASAVITFGIGQGLKSVILHEATSSRGLSLYHLEAISKMANQALQFELRSTAPAAFFVWLMANQFGTASQAAFGTASSKANFTSPIKIARITDNTLFTSAYAATDLSLPVPGEMESVASRAFYALVAGEDNTIPFIIDGVMQSADPNTPLLTISPVSRPDYVDMTQYLTQISSADMRMMRGNLGANNIYAISEGILADVACSGYEMKGVEASSSDSTGVMSFTLPFACGTARKQYVMNSSFPIMDYYACTNGDPTVYLIEPSQTDVEIAAIWQCTMAASTVLVHSRLQEFNTIAVPLGEPWDSAPVSNIGPIVGYLGGQYYNIFGVYGSPALSFAFYTASISNGSDGHPLDMLTVAERTVAATLLTGLRKMGDLVLAGAETGDLGDFNLSISSTTGYYEVSALKLHLSGLQVLYIALPSFLLVLLFILITLYVTQNNGKTDLTSPVTMALIGLGSPYDGNVHGGATGEFDDETLYKSTRIYYGEEQNHLAQGYGGNGSHLIMSCSKEGITRPTKKIKYT